MLLKNNNHVLPLRADAKVLVTGAGADNIPRQAGGWTLSWQGDNNTNADFPGATSIWGGIRARDANARLHELEKPDVAVVVYGEQPYAEMMGDRQNLIDSDSTHLGLLQKFKAAGVPVVSVFISGRPLAVNRFINASDAFVATWLPGTEGKGVADLLFGLHDFTGKLSFTWSSDFPRGYGLDFKSERQVPDLVPEIETAAEALKWKIEAADGGLTLTPDQDVTRETNAGLALTFDSAGRTISVPLRCLGKPPFHFAVPTVENVRLVPGTEGPCP